MKTPGPKDSDLIKKGEQNPFEIQIVLAGGSKEDPEANWSFSSLVKDQHGEDVLVEGNTPNEVVAKVLVIDPNARIQQGRWMTNPDMTAQEWRAENKKAREENTENQK